MSENASKKNTGRPAMNFPVAAAELQDNLRRLDRLASLGLVAASAAHEIKNGLVAVSTFTQVLAEKNEDKEMAAVVQRELKRIDSLVTQMLRFASPKPATLALVPVHQVLDHSIRLLEHQMTGLKIALKRDYLADPGTVLGDEAQLQQVFMNLMLNAIEAIEGGGELAVRTEVTSDYPAAKKLKIHFSDTGCGIAPEQMARVFDPFYTTKKNGTGLGLAICQRVAQEHQGFIEVQSVPGKGSTFTVSLTSA
jgi:signal transduction histidine kinase